MNYNINGSLQEEPATIPSNKIFQERSEAAQEIISKKSSFVEKWALLIFVSLLSGIVIAAWFIKYPDFVTGKAILFGEVSPSEIVATPGGRLISMLVKNHQQVKSGEILGWLESDSSKYSLLSPAEGQVELIEPVQKNGYVEAGKLLGYIVPANDHYFAKVKLSQANLGKLDTGMKVQLRINAYPYREKGYLPGRLIDLANIAVDSAFTGTILLDKGLITNRDKIIPFKAGLQAEAVIITKETRLLQRFYNQFYSD